MTPARRHWITATSAEPIPITSIARTRHPACRLATPEIEHHSDRRSAEGAAAESDHRMNGKQRAALMRLAATATGAGRQGAAVKHDADIVDPQAAKREPDRRAQHSAERTANPAASPPMMVMTGGGHCRGTSARR